MSDDATRAGDGDLEGMFLNAVAARQSGDVAQARALHRELLRLEPRLAEPYLELATIAADEGDVDEAEELARCGVEQLRHGGQWVADLGEGEMMAFALNLLGEVLVRQAEERVIDEPERFRDLWNEAAGLFREALRHDPANPDARRNATHCRPQGAAGD